MNLLNLIAFWFWNFCFAAEFCGDSDAYEVELVVSFDLQGSLRPLWHEIRWAVNRTIPQIWSSFPNARVTGIQAFNDRPQELPDGDDSRVIFTFRQPPTNSMEDLQKGFVLTSHFLEDHPWRDLKGPTIVTPWYLPTAGKYDFAEGEGSAGLDIVYHMIRDYPWSSARGPKIHLLITTAVPRVFGHSDTVWDSQNTLWENIASVRSAYIDVPQAHTRVQDDRGVYTLVYTGMTAAGANAMPVWSDYLSELGQGRFSEVGYIYPEQPNKTSNYIVRDIAKLACDWVEYNKVTDLETTEEAESTDVPTAIPPLPDTTEEPPTTSGTTTAPSTTTETISSTTEEALDPPTSFPPTSSEYTTDTGGDITMAPPTASTQPNPGVGGTLIVTAATVGLLALLLGTGLLLMRNSSSEVIEDFPDEEGTTARETIVRISE